MEHTKEALRRHNVPSMWIVLLALAMLVAHGLITGTSSDYEADKVEQGQ